MTYRQLSYRRTRVTQRFPEQESKLRSRDRKAREPEGRGLQGLGHWPVVSVPLCLLLILSGQVEETKFKSALGHLWRGCWLQSLHITRINLERKKSSGFPVALEDGSVLYFLHTWPR